jgi:hypothetical protein
LSRRRSAMRKRQGPASYLAALTKRVMAFPQMRLPRRDREWPLYVDSGRIRASRLRKQLTFPDGKAKGAISTQARRPGQSRYGRKAPKSGPFKALDMRLPERLCTVVDENEMNVVGCQAIGGRPPAGACGVGSPGIAVTCVVVLAEERRQGK